MADLIKSVGYMQQGKAAAAEGKAKRQAKDYEAAQLEQNAMQSVAAGQQNAREEERKARLVASRAVAVAAAGGGGVTDPTVAKIIADIDGEGSYRAGVALYRGEDEARVQRQKATAARYEGAVAEESGRMQRRAYNMQAAASAAESAQSMFGKYG